MAREIDVANTKAGLLQQGIQRAEQLMGDVLENQDFFHGQPRL
jgi:hypothetical protein